MSLLDLVKLNMYVSSKYLWMGLYMEALVAMFSIEIFMTNVWVTMVLAVLFVVNMTYECYSKVSRCMCSMYTYTPTPPTDSSDGIIVNNPISHTNRLKDTGIELSKIA